MNPTEIYQYKPQLKRTIYNYSFSQIVNLPGYMEKYDSMNLKEKKKGKKMFLPKDNEKKVGQGRNKNRKLYLNNITSNIFHAKKKELVFDDPVITCKNIKAMNKTINIS